MPVIEPEMWREPKRDDGGSEPPDNDGMGARISKLEAIAEQTSARLDSIDVRLAKVDAAMPALATAADMHKAFADQMKWIVGTGFAGVALFITVMTFVLNNAVPRTAPPPAQPTVVVVPALAAPQPAQAASR